MGKSDAAVQEAARSALQGLLRSAHESARDGLNQDSPLSLEVSGKYVEVLFTTGGPHVELLVQYDHEDDAEYWFENRPRWGLLKYRDWFVGADVSVDADDVAEIMAAILRDPDDEPEDDDEV